MKIAQLNNRLEAWVHPVSKFMSRIGSVVLFLMMLLTTIDVLLRKFSILPLLLGTVELTEFMLVIVILFALAQTEVLNGHVKVDLVLSRFSERSQAFVDMITQLVCFILSALITWSTVVYSVKMKASGEVSQDLWLPVYPFVWVVAAGCAVLSLTLLIKFFLAMTKLVKS
jgi:TRAP-type mannitol/chloroaromatic compound transport system permease small subunit